MLAAISTTARIWDAAKSPHHRKQVWAMLSSFLAFVVFGAKKGLLVYRMDVRCQNRPPTVRDAFSKALRAKNRLLWYGRDIRYQKPPPTVRDASSVREFFSVQYTLTL